MDIKSLAVMPVRLNHDVSSARCLSFEFLQFGIQTTGQKCQCASNFYTSKETHLRNCSKQGNPLIAKSFSTSTSTASVVQFQLEKLKRQNTTSEQLNHKCTYCLYGLQVIVVVCPFHKVIYTSPPGPDFIIVTVEVVNSDCNM